MISARTVTGQIAARPLAERFWEKVRRGRGCWEWTARRFKNGYGSIRSGDRQLLAHRIAWELTRGPIPSGLLICHHCDNPPCVRPSHLFLGTHQMNLDDCRRKGRAAKPDQTTRASESNGAAKLTASKVRRLRERYRRGGVTQAALAREYKVSIPLIEKILGGRLWRYPEAGYGLLGEMKDDMKAKVKP